MRIAEDGCLEMRTAGSFTEDALKLKDGTLPWADVTEWCLTATTFLLTRSLLWYLMVGRHLYRIVDETKLRPPPRGDSFQVSHEQGVRNREPTAPCGRELGSSRLTILRQMMGRQDTATLLGIPGSAC